MMSISDLQINSERLRADFDALAEIGITTTGGITRLALSNEDLQARAWFASRIDEAGLLVNDDEAGNLSGVLYCSQPAARTLLIGSHLDSVPNGGKYDGAIGVLAALECLRVIKEAQLDLPVHLEAINFTDEEGCWYNQFGSKALTGQLPPLNHTDKSIRDQAAFRAALFRAGIRHTEVHRAKRSKNTLAGYLELHIEQGARLYRQNVDIGIVTGIVGRITHYINFNSEASHSGTTAKEDRHDALHAAATFIHEAHNTLWDDEGIFNCGNVKVLPGTFNVVPESAQLNVECRHPDQQKLATMESAMIRIAQNAARQCGLSVTVQQKTHIPPVNMDAAVIACIEAACQQRNITSHTHLVSYAGHDAQMMSSKTPSGMIFIPSYNGYSHNPKEFSEWHHIEQGANVLLQSVLNFAMRCAEA